MISRPEGATKTLALSTHLGSIAKKEKSFFDFRKAYLTSLSKRAKFVPNPKGDAIQLFFLMASLREKINDNAVRMLEDEGN